MSRQALSDDGDIPAGGVPLKLTLGTAPLHFRGRIRAVDATAADSILAPAELEKRLLEMGFVEGAGVEIRHQGLFGGDPIAVRVHGATVALRRREARAILVEKLD